MAYKCLGFSQHESLLIHILIGIHISSLCHQESSHCIQAHYYEDYLTIFAVGTGYFSFLKKEKKMKKKIIKKGISSNTGEQMIVIKDYTYTWVKFFQSLHANKIT